MKLHEYQTKEILKRLNIPVPKGYLVDELGELDKTLLSLNGPPWVIKAQIHAGGRGQAGGIKVAKALKEARQITSELIGSRLVTKQTGKKGALVRKVLVEEFHELEKEYYVGITLDRKTASPTLIFSTMGGMDIEDVAATNPGAVAKVPIDPLLGFMPLHGRQAVYSVDPAPPKAIVPSLTSLFEKLFEVFMGQDCSLLEINPLGVTKDNMLLALDAKMVVDDNALFRHRDLASMEDKTEKDALELEAENFRLNYIKLDGQVGVMVNGAGLAMATMDIIKLAGANPANFLDVGGGASEEMVKKGFQIILKDPNVRLILINIFGGILRCDVLAKGIIGAAKGIDLNLPLIIRLEGTNVEEGRELLKGSGLSFLVAQDIKDTVRLIKEQLGTGV